MSSEEIADASDEDAISGLSAPGRACRARGIWRTTRHTDSTILRQTAGRPIT